MLFHYDTAIFFRHVGFTVHPPRDARRWLMMPHRLPSSCYRSSGVFVFLITLPPLTGAPHTAIAISHGY